MCNLKKLREDGKDDEMIHLLNTTRMYFIAQDALNAACRGGIKEMSGNYNASAYTVPANDPKIIHYAGIRGAWREYPAVKYYRDLPWDEIRI